MQMRLTEYLRIRASVLARKGMVRASSELLCDRSQAAIRRMPAAGFARELIAGKPAPTKPRLRSWSGRTLVGAASGRDATHAGRGLRSRADRGQARSHQTPAPFVFVASFCGSGLWPRYGACRPRASFEAESRASPLPLNPGSVRVCRELLWERPLAAMGHMPAAGFVRELIAGKPAPNKPRLRSWSGRTLVGAASGRDAAHAGRRLRSRADRGQARSHETPAPFVFVASSCGSGLWPRYGACRPRASLEAASRAIPFALTPGPSPTDVGEGRPAPLPMCLTDERGEAGRRGSVLLKSYRRCGYGTVARIIRDDVPHSISRIAPSWRIAHDWWLK